MELISGYEGLSTHFYVDVFQPVIDEISLKQQITNEIDRFGSVYSRFNKDSLLSKLNTEKVVPIDKDLANMLRLGLQMEKETNGVFSLFVKSKLEAKGYGVETGILDERGEIEISNNEIRLISGSIDLGGIGKGYLIDTLAKILQNHSVDYFLINAGGDMYTTSDNGRPVTVYMQHPIHREAVIGELSLYNQAFCCSSSYVRSWIHNGEKKNHFITPDNKEIWSASYVVGGSASLVDMLATVICIQANDSESVYQYEKMFACTALVYNESFSTWRGSLNFTSLV
jgi:thiamine biosynthesis lipoprotein